MPVVYRTSLANRDLVEIALTIAEENSQAADHWLDSIDSRCQLLAQMSGLGRLRPDLAPKLRGFPVGNHIIFYRERNDGIEVIRVLHGARDLPPLFE